MTATQSSVSTPGSAKHRRKSNSDGMALTKSGRVSVSKNEVNEKYDASYRNSDNSNKLLGKLLNLGQACGIIGIALHGADVLLEDSGNVLHILQILHILHNLIILPFMLDFDSGRDVQATLIA